MKRNKEEIQLVEDWLRFARENILFAKAGMEQEMALYHSICFLCQQSAEKYLKAFLIWNGWKLKKIHDLSELINYCSEYDESFENLFPESELLNVYLTEGRYPGDLPFGSIGRKDAAEAINAAENIETHVIKAVAI